jgi:hypothetical protein
MYISMMVECKQDKEFYTYCVCSIKCDAHLAPLVRGNILLVNRHILTLALDVAQLAGASDLTLDL